MQARPARTVHREAHIALAQAAQAVVYDGPPPVERKGPTAAAAGARAKPVPAKVQIPCTPRPRPRHCGRDSRAEHALVVLRLLPLLVHAAGLLLLLPPACRSAAARPARPLPASAHRPHARSAAECRLLLMLTPCRHTGGQTPCSAREPSRSARCGPPRPGRQPQVPLRPAIRGGAVAGGRRRCSGSSSSCRGQAHVGLHGSGSGGASCRPRA